MLRSSRLFVAGALTFGFGLGGLADGIVLHQVLQWHNLVSERIPNTELAGLRVNVFWDGVFHLVVTALVVAGITMLWRSATPSGSSAGQRALWGVALVGWGSFHVVDQLLFHVLLRLHDIRMGVANPQVYNWSFFGVGLVLVAAGAALCRGELSRRR